MVIEPAAVTELVEVSLSLRSLSLSKCRNVEILTIFFIIFDIIKLIFSYFNRYDKFYPLTNENKLRETTGAQARRTQARRLLAIFLLT